MQKQLPPFDDLIESMRRGSAGALARLITIVENRSPGWLDIMKTLYPESTHAILIGITGPPGSGKSTLTDQLAIRYSAKGKRVGIIAIDPSSPKSGGAFLGDRIRMKTAIESKHVFIRSMSSRGALGGLSKAAIDAARLMAASGMNYIFLETVGIGQAEVDVVSFADLVLVVCAPNMGNGIQAIKAGIMEIGDLFVVNKADIDGADLTLRDLRSMIGMRDHSSFGTQVLKTIATEATGIEELINTIDDSLEIIRGNGDRGKDRFRDEVLNAVKYSLSSYMHNLLCNSLLVDKLSELATIGKDPYSATEDIIIHIIQYLKKCSFNQQYASIVNQEEK